MIRAVLIDDEADALNALDIDLKKYCAEDVKVLEKCQSPIEGLKAIRRLKPDLVFLDIDMPDLNGFELLEILGNIEFQIIFVSAFNEYALKAFKVSAVDFLLKPVDKDELILAVKKVKQKEGGSPPQEFKVLLENMNQIQTIAIKSQGEYRFFQVSEIMYCQADGNFCFLYLHGGHTKREHSSYSLSKMEELLPETLFFRVHASYLINKAFLRKYLKRGGSHIVMKDGAKVPVARSRKEDFDKWLGFDDN